MSSAQIALNPLVNLPSIYTDSKSKLASPVIELLRKVDGLATDIIAEATPSDVVNKNEPDKSLYGTCVKVFFSLLEKCVSKNEDNTFIKTAAVITLSVIAGTCFYYMGRDYNVKMKADEELEINRNWTKSKLLKFKENSTDPNFNKIMDILSKVRSIYKQIKFTAERSLISKICLISSVVIAIIGVVFSSAAMLSIGCILTVACISYMTYQRGLDSNKFKNKNKEVAEELKAEVEKLLAYKNEPAVVPVTPQKGRLQNAKDFMGSVFHRICGG